MTDTASEILQVMVGTAGHVDHGKTSLVRNLTQVETDTLKEERERGLTIDFGVAPCRLTDERMVGIIDVPGHRDFIRNMVAGASSIDVLMLVVAADDSVMPQTAEHMRIASMLGMSRLMVALTKIDLVDEETIAIVEDDLREFLEDLGYKDVPVVHVSNETGQGIEEVRSKITSLVAEIPRRQEAKAFRMYVRKAFTMKGYGTVVTGVPQSGECQSGDRIQLLPPDRLCGIRALQNYRHEAKTVRAHISTAINLRDIEPRELQRGMALVTPGSFRTTKHAVTTVRNHGTSPVLGKRIKLRFHLGTIAAVADAHSLTEKAIEPGESGLVALSFHYPQIFCVGDSCILRTLSPAETIGGGRVLSLRDQRVTTQGPAFCQRLTEAAAAVEAGEFVRALCYGNEQPIVELKQAILSTELDETEVKQSIAALIKEQILAEIGDDSWLVVPRVNEFRDVLKRQLRGYHKANPLSLGMQQSYVCDLLRIPKSGFVGLWKHLKGDSDLKLRNNCLALSDFEPAISAREIALRDAILGALEKAGMQSIAKGNLQAELKIAEKEWRRIIKLLSDEGEIAVFGSNLVSRSVVDYLEQKLLELFATKEIVELKEFRDATATSRNVAVHVLEHFDSRGLTKRKGDGRILVRKS